MRLIAIAAGALAVLAAAASTGQSAPLDAGERAFQKCYSCHDLAAGRNDLTGPSLHGIVGRRVAAEQGFTYSPAMRHFALEHPAWSPELLDRFIADPEASVPRTTMSFAGMRDPKERATLIAYLERSSKDGP